MTDPTQETTLTAHEVLENMLALEQEAKEVLPGKFDECTFKMGNIRQRIYACKTCNPPHQELSVAAGMCYSCSISCHGNHDLIELFEKRNFRCDCGVGTKFGEFKCTLETKLKEGQSNDKNSYNHNFKNRFCWCNVDYDPEKTEEDMIQCLVCEDWFHESHIGCAPSMDEFDSYICRTCTARLPFLKSYAEDPKFVFGLTFESNDGRVTRIQHPRAHALAVAEEEVVKVVDTVNSNSKRSLGATVEDDSDAKRLRFEVEAVDRNASSCKREGAIIPECEVHLFLKENWRSGLCTCHTCIELYKESGVEYLLQEEVTYEPEEDEDIFVSQYEASLNELGRMPRAPAIEGSIAIGKMIDKLKQYLNTFRESGKSVAKEDVDKFFAELHQERASKKTV